MKELIIINDVEAPVYLAETLSEIGLKVVHATEMTAEIVRATLWQQADPAATLLVFPGHGAETFRSFLPREWLRQWRATAVFAKRLWFPGSPPQAIASVIHPNRLLFGIHDIIVIDDVISSGETMRKLYTVNQPWIPCARWHAVAWVKQRSAKLRSFTSVVCAAEAGTEKLKAAINSLSTLIENREIANDFAMRHFTPTAEKAFHRAIGKLHAEWLLRQAPWLPIRPF